MRHYHEEEHACDLGRAFDDLEELADEGLEELENFQEAKQLQVKEKDGSYFNAAMNVLLVFIDGGVPVSDRDLL